MTCGAPRTTDGDEAPQESCSLTIISEPGSASLVRALGLLSVSGLCPQSLMMRHRNGDGQAVSLISLAAGTDFARLSATCLKIRQLPSVSSAELAIENRKP